MSGFNDFMDKAGAFASMAAGKAKDLAAAAAVKTKQVSRVAKLNMDISGQKDTIKKAYAEIGRLYYEAHHDAPEAGLAQACQQVDAAKEAIAKMEAEIVELKAVIGQDDTSAVDADFAAVVDETAAEADVEVEVTVEEATIQPAPETPAEPEPEAPAEPEPEAPAEPEPEAPVEPAPETPADEEPHWN